MASDSKIEWTDHTFNGWWGCQKVHAGCAHCYAEATDHRWGGDHWGPKQPRRFILGEWSKPAKWQREAERAGVMRHVFASSMCDVFEDYDGPMVDVHGNKVDHTLESCRARIFEMIEQTPNLMWLLLTKRPENVTRMVPASWMQSWPTNVMTGTSPCDQHTADKCIPELLKVPGKRFLSMEPLLGAVNVTDQPLWDWRYTYKYFRVIYPDAGPPIHWVIVGGESGSGARPMDIEWVRSIRDQCQAAGVPCFVKQLGSAPTGFVNIDNIGNGYAVTLDLKDKKGGDWSEWPEDLRVREMPDHFVDANKMICERCGGDLNARGRCAACMAVFVRRDGEGPETREAGE